MFLSSTRVLAKAPTTIGKTCCRSLSTSCVLRNQEINERKVSEPRQQKTQSWDVLRNISSSFKLSDGKPVNTEPKKNKDLPKLEKVEREAAIDTKQPAAKIEQQKKTKSFTEVVTETETATKLVQKILEASSAISKVAQLNILNEHLAKNPNFLSNAQKTSLVHNLTATNGQNVKRRYLEAVRCTMNLIGMPDKPKGSGIKILCIDGGGTRGLAPLEMLNTLENACVEKGILKRENLESSTEFLSQFDLICGVSTGSVVAFMTAVAGISFSSSVNMYRKMASEIFQRSSILGVSSAWPSVLTGYSWYDTEKWLKILQSYEKSFDPVYMASKEKNSPLISAVSVVTSQERLRPYVLRSYGFRPDSKSRYLGGSYLENWEVLHATTAAPFYFDAFAYGDMVLQDGGILLNNPTALAIHEARALWPKEEIQLVLSMGTGLQRSLKKEELQLPPNKQQSKAIKTEYIKNFNNFIDSVGSAEVVHTTLKDLLPQGTYFRFNPRYSDSFDIDEFRAEKLNELTKETTQYMAQPQQQNRVERFVNCFAQTRSTKTKLRDMWYERSEKVFSD